MSEIRRVIPDIAHEFPLNGEDKIVVSGIYDHLYYYEPLNVHWLRYFAEDHTVCMVVLKDAAAEVIKTHTDVPFSVRETIFQREHDTLVTALGGWATDSLFDLDIDADAIEAEESRLAPPTGEPDTSIDPPTSK